MEAWYRNLPSVTEIDQALQSAGFANPKLQRQIALAWLDSVREQLPHWLAQSKLPEWMHHKSSLLQELVQQLTQLRSTTLTPVINATGVVLHTNLGRAPLSPSLLQEVIPRWTRYTDLEFDLETGQRGQRTDRLQQLLQNLSGAEDALVVNNNAAAVFLLMRALCHGGEVLVSRGELVEIGGSFRIPDILREAGATLVEVGTTNRTRLQDYVDGRTERTVAILKVHPSNFVMQGFTESVELADLVAWSHQQDLPTFYDWGSGTFYRFHQQALQQVPTIVQELETQVDVLCLSGDKLLGGPQAGLLLGKRQYLGPLRRHPLYRALRPDKGTLSLLELTLQRYLDLGQAAQEIPTLWLLERTQAELLERAEAVQSQLTIGQGWTVQVAETESLAGGGGLPEVRLPSAALLLKPTTLPAHQAQQWLRQQKTPVITMVRNNQLILDFRTVFPEDESLLLTSLQDLINT